MIIIVVEAGERSGAIITANLALEQGKEIFAVPGDITKKQSIGTNKLIKEGAIPIIQEDDVKSIIKTQKNKSIIILKGEEL